MASAGRILIMPKGAYDSSTTYEMLDMVSYNGKSWLAKKTVVGVEPSSANSEYWHDLITVTPESIGALSINGGSLLGALGLGNGNGYIHADSDNTVLNATKDNDNYRYLRIINPAREDVLLKYIAQLVNGVDGAETTYTLFGEHNLDLLKTYIDQMIADYLNNNP